MRIEPELVRDRRRQPVMPAPEVHGPRGDHDRQALVRDDHAEGSQVAPRSPRTTSARRHARHAARQPHHHASPPRPRCDRGRRSTTTEGRAQEMGRQPRAARLRQPPSGARRRGPRRRRVQARPPGWTASSQPAPAHPRPAAAAGCPAAPAPPAGRAAATSSPGRAATPCRRATSPTDAPGTWLSATTRGFVSAGQLRRPHGCSIASTRPANPDPSIDVTSLARGRREDTACKPKAAREIRSEWGGDTACRPGPPPAPRLHAGRRAVGGPSQAIGRKGLNRMKSSSASTGAPSSSISPRSSPPTGG